MRFKFTLTVCLSKGCYPGARKQKRILKFQTHSKLPKKKKQKVETKHKLTLWTLCIIRVLLLAFAPCCLFRSNSLKAESVKSIVPFVILWPSIKTIKLKLRMKAWRKEWWYLPNVVLVVVINCPEGETVRNDSLILYGWLPDVGISAPSTNRN